MTTINKYLGIFVALIVSTTGLAQTKPDSIFSFRKGEDVTITIDHPGDYDSKKKTIIIYYALPNGNTTAQTMGKRLKPGDDWHFDIQHIRAQTKFIRQQLEENVVVVYLENDMKSWPAWKAKHADYTNLTRQIISAAYTLYAGTEREIYLNGHSGGGRFILSYIDAVPFIPPNIKRISFIDSNYGYDSTYLPKLQEWLNYKDTHLNVFAYNDSIALYNGKPVVSATGGTWYRSRRMMRDLGLPLTELRTDSVMQYRSKDARLQFFLKPNPDRGIYHTQQVERNGFIHSVLCGTPPDSKGYRYYGERAYGHLIEDSVIIQQVVIK